MIYIKIHHILSLSFRACKILIHIVQIIAENKIKIFSLWTNKYKTEGAIKRHTYIHTNIHTYIHIDRHMERNSQIILYSDIFMRDTYIIFAFLKAEYSWVDEKLSSKLKWERWVLLKLIYNFRERNYTLGIFNIRNKRGKIKLFSIILLAYRSVKSGSPSKGINSF